MADQKRERVLLNCNDGTYLGRRVAGGNPCPARKCDSQDDFPAELRAVTLGANRFDLKYGMGGLSHQALLTNIELYGSQVVPQVRELLA